jgi:ABC-2 type transport system permease protein
MTSVTTAYTRFELLRTLRNVRFMFFSLAFPLVLYFLVAGSNRHVKLAHLPFPVYYLAGMASWGTMTAVTSIGARIALERQVGWTRQLRITPLSTRAYFGSKLLSGYLVALLALAILCLAGLSLGVSLTGGAWASMIGLILVGLIPFAVMGVLLGHLVSPDSAGPALGGGTAVFALLGGAWGPLGSSGFLHDLTKLIPSYWLVQAGHSAYTHQGWPLQGWIVLIVWTLALLRITARVYRRDTGRA